MRDPVIADLARHEREQAEGERLLEMAAARRGELVAAFIEDGRHETTLLDCLADLAAGDAEFLHALQRGDIKCMQRLFREKIDRCEGDDLVDEEAQRMEGT